MNALAARWSSSKRDWNRTRRKRRRSSRVRRNISRERFVLLLIRIHCNMKTAIVPKTLETSAQRHNKTKWSGIVKIDIQSCQLMDEYAEDLRKESAVKESSGDSRMLS